MTPNMLNLIHMVLVEIVLPFTILGVVWFAVKGLIDVRKHVATIRRRMNPPE